MPDDLPPDTGERDWHWRDEEPDDKPLTPEGERQSQLVLMVLAIAALGGVAIGLMTWLGLWSSAGPAHVVSLIVWDHKNFPEHLVALADSDAILHHFAELPEVHRLHSKQSQSRDDLEAELRKLAKQREGPVIVHVCCQALARGGEVYLLPEDADPDDESTWLKLTTVLDSVGQCPAKHKLLLLDIAHPLADSRLGLLCDDVADGVRQALDKAPRFWVLTSCGPGQTALQCQALGQSVFAHFVDQGLAGAADGWGPTGEADKRLMVKELAAYVRYQTEAWAKQNHGVKQTPWLAGQAEDFRLVDLAVGKPALTIEEALKAAKAAQEAAKAAQKQDAKADAKGEEKKDDGKGEKKEPPPRFPYPPELKEAWQLRDKLAGASRDRLGPSVLLSIDMQLLNAEKNWPSGTPAGGASRDQLLGRNLKADLQHLVQKMQQLDKQLAKLTIAQGWDRPPTLLLAAASYPEPDPALLKNLVEKLKGVTVAPKKDLSAKERDELAKQEAKEMAGVQDEVLKLFKEQKEAMKESVQQATALLKAAADPDLGGLNRLQAALIRDTLAKILGKDDYVETLWFKRTGDFEKFIRQDTKDQEVWAWPSEKIGQALRTRVAALALDALLAEEPELLPRLDKNRFRQAEDDRRQGEARLFWGKPGQWKDAGDKLRQADDSYRALYDQLNEVRTARFARQEALLKLPGWYLWLTAEGDSEDDAAWQEPWDEARALLRDLTRQLSADPSQQTEIKGADLMRSLTTLSTRHIKVFEESTKLAKEQTPGAFARLQALAAGPELNADQRAQLWQAAHELDETYSKWEPETAPVRAITLAAPEANAEPQIRAARRKAKLSLDLLTLAGVDTAEARKDWDDVTAAPSTPRDWDKLGRSLRKAWRSVDRGAKEEVDAPAACVGRLFPMVGRDGSADELMINSDAKASGDFKAWLGARFRGEAKHLEEFDKSEVPGNSAFFSKTAARLER